MVDTFVTWLSGSPCAPDVMPSPFDDVGPHPLAKDAALELQARLSSGVICDGVSASVLRAPEGGKMFGVLVVRSRDGRLGVLRAFSGQLAGRWDLPGFVPPLFDVAARDALEPASDVLVKRYGAMLADLEASPALAASRRRVTEFDAEAAQRRGALKQEHRERKERRRVLRETADPPAARALDEESRADDRARRGLEATLRTERVQLETGLRALERRLAAVARLRRVVSQEAMRRIHDTYVLENVHGQTSTVRALFAPVEPPWGAGDCAAPKLIAFALRHHLVPVALAEFWWGAPPPGGGRVEGVFFPACREKCGPILPFLLSGLPVAERRRYRASEVSCELRTVFEDDRLVVLEKPSGLLSVPGLDAGVTDSVLARLKAKYPNASGPLLVHRLDLDTSGLMLAALDAEAHRLLQAQFIDRSVHKRYVALLDGVLTTTRGSVCLPLRVDLEQRPRQLVDFEHGRPATTDWRRLCIERGRTRVELTPHTGRTHQLRVHCAHEAGLGIPIVGDRLYGRPSTRLHLHAHSLTFRHPGTNALLSFESGVPF